MQRGPESAAASLPTVAFFRAGTGARTSTGTSTRAGTGTSTRTSTRAGAPAIEVLRVEGAPNGLLAAHAPARVGAGARRRQRASEERAGPSGGSGARRW